MKEDNLKYLNLTFVLFILLTSCNKSDEVFVHIKSTFTDTLSSQIEKEMAFVRDSIWQNDTSELKNALILHSILDPEKQERFPDRLDSLEMRLDSTFARYQNLYTLDSLSFTPKYDVISTITNEQFHKSYFYSSICELLGFDKATVYKIETMHMSDSLIIKKFTLGWRRDKGIADGTVEVCFVRDSIFINTSEDQL